MRRMIYLSSFGAQSLHNGTTILAKATAVQPRQAKPRLLELPNGGFFDLDGSSPTRFIPSPVKTEILLKHSSESAADTTLAALTALVGTKATLTGTKLAGGTMTCTARCTGLKIVSRNRSRGLRISVELTFQPVDDWA